MRLVQRVVLDARAVAYLRKRQKQANAKEVAGNLNTDGEWKSARQTKTMGSVLASLQSMMGRRQRCMYCLDSHGCDIEHFYPKSNYAKRMFRWNNLLLCCTECGRIKGSKFPMAGNRRLLIDPCKEEPWQYLDFDPTTGNMTARFDLQANAFTPKGLATVATLQLDQREALAAGYQQTYQRLRDVIGQFLQQPSTAADLITSLIAADDHGLLGWFFKGNGQTEQLANQLRAQHLAVWNDCYAAFQYR